MDPNFDHIFQDLYNALSNRDDANRARITEAAAFRSDEPVRTVRRTIEQAEQSLSESDRLSLRSDARYFLLLNLTEMVARPIQVRTGIPPFSGPSKELDSLLRADLDLLLSEAARRHLVRQRSAGTRAELDREISGHSVVEALAANWTRLKLNSYRIWGER